MRIALNAILSFIGSESLTDEEWAVVNALDLGDDEYAEQFSALTDILRDREAISSIRDRLKYYFKAQGVALPDDEDDDSNILVGMEIS